ncbi:MAG TPA: glycosyltransferase [Vicinamibacterales bacterium]|nr:glycosyltransferase [Vicinamibacterales bacterium]
MTLHLVTPEYPPRHGGVADYTHQVATELSRSGETVHVWGPTGSAAQPGSAVVVHPDLGRFRAADLRRVSVLLDAYSAPRRLVVQWVPHGYGQRAMNLQFCLWLWRRSVAGDWVDLIAHEPFMTFTGGMRQRVVAAVQRAMTLVVMSAARRVWVTTRAWTPLLEPYLAGRAVTIQWLPVPSSLHSAHPVAVSEVRTRYAPGRDPLVGHFGTYGSLVASLLDEAIAAVAAAHPSAHFLMIGSGSEAFRLALVARERTLESRVSATGTLDAAALSAHVEACDVLLQPYPDGVTSRRTTVMAGLFARVPIVTTEGKLTERFWRDEAPVKLAAVGDARGVAEHVVALLADSAERQRQADAGRAFYDRWFDVRHTVAALAAS